MTTGVRVRLLADGAALREHQRHQRGDHRRLRSASASAAAAHNEPVLEHPHVGSSEAPTPPPERLEPAPPPVRPVLPPPPLPLEPVLLVPEEQPSVPLAVEQVVLLGQLWLAKPTLAQHTRPSS